MGTAALTVRIPLLSRAAQPGRAYGLAFDQPGGAVVAVCGLVGGSGASTLAYCIARQSAQESQAPVLLTEHHHTDGGLAALVGHTTELGFGGLASCLAAGHQPPHTFLELEHGLRIIAAAHQHDPAPAADDSAALLDEARAAHGLVVVDCGTLAGRPARMLELATHVVWTLPATDPALARAAVLLEASTLPAPGSRREVLVAIATQPAARASVRALRRVAQRRCDRLVLVPHSTALARGQLGHGAQDVARTLTGLASVLRSNR